MKIKQITAYLVETSTKDDSRHLEAPYLRVQLEDTIIWFAKNYDDEFIELPAYQNLKRILEEEFTTTHGLIHEQLELF